MTSNNTSVIVCPMAARHDRDISHEELLAREKAIDPQFAREWDQETPARMVASQLVRYRYDHNLSQLQLAKLVGVKQPQIARWEIGETLPSPPNLARLAGKLGLEFVFSYAPANRKLKLITKSATDDAEAYEVHNAIVRCAAS